jgi:hypothetical protein
VGHLVTRGHKFGDLALRILGLDARLTTLLYKRKYCNMDGQSTARQRLSKHSKTYVTTEVRVFIARCWATSSAATVAMQRFGKHVATIERSFLCGRREAIKRDSDNIRSSSRRVENETNSRRVPNEK